MPAPPLSGICSEHSPELLEVGSEFLFFHTLLLLWGPNSAPAIRVIEKRVGKDIFVQFSL